MPIAAIRSIVRGCFGNRAHNLASVLFITCTLAALANLSTVAAQATQDSRPAPTSPEPAAAKARIYVYREKRITGSAGYDRLFVNDTFLAALHSGRFASSKVPQGTVVISSVARLNSAFVGEAELMKLQKNARELLRIQVEAGRTYYVKWSIGEKVKLVDEATGAKELNKLEPAKDEDLQLR